MLLSAAQVVEQPALDPILRMNQPLLAARAMQGIGQRQALVVAVFVDQLEQPDYAGWRELRAFIVVEPDSLTGETQIKLDLAGELAQEALRAHRRLAGRTNGVAQSGSSARNTNSVAVALPEYSGINTSPCSV